MGKYTGSIDEAASARQAYLEKYGSFLFCAKRNTLCVHMDGMWLTGCERELCILDDPEYQRLQERIEDNRERREEEAKKQRLAEMDAAPIRDQRNMIKSHVERSMEEIRRIEEESRMAYRQNRPGWGNQLFNRAQRKRYELKEWQEKNGVEWKNI